MGEITISTPQSMYNTFCDFLKRFVCPETSNEKPNNEELNSSTCCVSSDTVFDGDIVADDDCLVLTSLTLTTANEKLLCSYEPMFVSTAKMQLFSQNISPWTLALKRRRLERNCRKDPFTRYDMNFVTDELKDLWLRKSNEKCLDDDGSSIVDEIYNEGSDSTRSPSPCRSSSTLSSAYSSEELSSVSSVSQYSCLFTSELSSQEEEPSGEVYYDTQAGQTREIMPYSARTQFLYDIKPRHRLPSSRSEKDATYFDELRLRGHVERAFKYCKLFEILEQPCNRFRISPSSCGLGLPLTHLDRYWPPVAASDALRQEYVKDSRRQLLSPHMKKKKRGSRSEAEDMLEQSHHPFSKFDDTMQTMPLHYVSSSSSLYEENNFCVSEMDVLSEEIWDYHMSVTQSEEALNVKMQLRDVLYCALSQLFPMCGLYVVGSSLNGFGTNSSDMDLSLMISTKEINQRTDAVVVLDLVRNLFQNMSLIREQKLIIAKVPILRIKFHDPYANITVDLNANNSVAIRNTQLLCYYSYYDWRVRPLVSVVKEWAKRRDINDANRSSFTSYSLVLMVIHYLQCEAKLLPSLQEKYPKVFNQRVDVRTLSVSLPLEQQAVCQKIFDSHDRPTLGELLLGFFEYFARKFDYSTDAISVRLGRKLERHFVTNQQYSYHGSNISQWNYICIEEPFNYTNTAHSIHDQNVFEMIRLAFIEDYYKLEQTRDLRLFLDINPLNDHQATLQGSIRPGSSETLVEDSAGTSTISTSSSFAHCQSMFSEDFKLASGSSYSD